MNLLSFGSEEETKIYINRFAELNPIEDQHFSSKRNLFESASHIAYSIMVIIR